MTKAFICAVIVVSFAIFVPERGPWAVVSGQAPQPAQQPPTQAQQRPVFRGGTHFVRVDAYPTKDGRIIEGLTPEDFDVFEDGKPQKIESFDFIKFDTFTPEAERREPHTQEEGFEMAADPRSRVFVILVDMVFSGSTDIHGIQQPLVEFLDRVVGPMDLFGFLTSRNTAKDLVLGRKTAVVDEQLRDMFRSANIDRDDADELDRCQADLKSLKPRFRADLTYTALETLVTQLGAIREERKSVVFVSNTITRAMPNPALLNLNGGSMPRPGITNGRIGIGNGGGSTSASDTYCTAQVQRLAAMDFDDRFRQLLVHARQQNVTFYTITPEGLTVNGRPDDNIITLATETDGLAIVNTNDLSGGMKRIADDLQAYYVLGYYTTNTRFDGGIRKITVRTKPAGKAIRARREYRAPTEAEIAALAQRGSASPAPGGAAEAAGPPAVIGEPVAYRVSRTQPLEQVKLLEFVRADRLRVTWPALTTLDRREARLLDSAGKPLPIDLPVAEDAAAKTVSVELPLAPLGRGVYAIELTAGSGDHTERRRLTFLMK